MSDPNAPIVLSFPDELYVGTKGLVGFDTENPPLAFATPFGSDAAFEKRKETVTRWCGDGTVHRWALMPDGSFKIDERGQRVWETVGVGTPMPPQVIQNVPLAGFSFDRAIERSVTDNKVFRVNDPRGFQLEITADNLADIILNTDIHRGVIQGEFIWGRLRGTNFLTRLDHPAYIRETTALNRELRVGDHIYLGSKTEELIYCGEFYVSSVGLKYVASRYHGVSFVRTEYVRIKPEKKDKKPFKIFRKVVDDYRRPYSMMRSPSKYTILSSGNPLPADFPQIGGDLSVLSFGEVTAFFHTKEEMMAFVSDQNAAKAAIIEDLGDTRTEYVFLADNEPDPSKYY